MMHAFVRVLGVAGSILLAAFVALVGGCAGGGEPLPPGTPSLPDATMVADASLDGMEPMADGMAPVPDASRTNCGHDERVQAGACVPCALGSSNAPGDPLAGPDTDCDAVGCPAGSSGDDIASGCVCAAGYDGMIVATGESPYFSGACEGVPCPEGTSGIDVPSGCMCDAGTVGEIMPSTEAPFYTGGCEMLLCMADERVSMNACVACDPGTSNEPGDDASSVDTTCDAVPCPPNSSGVDVASGCTCNDGFAGMIMATAMAPYYSGGCASATMTYSHSGSTETYTVPEGITSLRIVVSGSAGGNGSRSGTGGAGATIEGTFAVTAGQVLTLYAGGGQTTAQRGGDCSYVAMGVVAMAVGAGGGAGGFAERGQPGAITEAGTAPLAGTVASGTNGVPGSGGAGGGAGDGSWGTGGGGGWNSAGGAGSGSAGGAIRCMGSVGTTYAGGAGGGYSGGGGAAMASGWGTRGGGSGGSFNSGTSPMNTAGANTGLGAVSITAM